MMIKMKFKNVINMINLHIVRNCQLAKEYEDEGNTKMCNAHTGAVTGLLLLKEELTEYGE